MSDSPLKHYPFAKVLKTEVQKVEEMLGIALEWKLIQKEGLYYAERHGRSFVISRNWNDHFTWQIFDQPKDPSRGAGGWSDELCSSEAALKSFELAVLDIQAVMRKKGY